MKKLNVGLSIAILVLALISAIFSIILFSKRSEFLAGWDQFAEAVSKSAATLDKKSGDNKLSRQLAMQRLDHTNVGQVGDILPELNKRSVKIIAQRDAFAEALRRSASIVGSRDIPSDDELCSLSGYEKGKNNIVNSVNDAINRRNAIYNKLQQLFRQESGSLKSDLDIAGLKEGKLSALDPVVDALQRNRSRISVYERNLQEISRVAGENSSFRKGEDDYTQSVGKITTAVKAQDEKVNKLQSDLTGANNTISKQQSEIEEKDRTIAAKDNEIADRNALISGYRRALGLEDADANSVPWKDGFSEVRSAWVGKIKEVNRDYGYVVIDLGSGTTVKQKLGKNFLDVKVVPEKGMALVVARGDLASSADFVARVTLEEIGKEASTANIPLGANIKVGDIVYVAMP